MKYDRLVAVPQVSRLILGLDHQRDEAELYTGCAEYVELGGNTFDSAYQYLGWRELALGKFIRRERLQSQVNVIVKAGHSPLCTPQDVEQQLSESLENLGLERAPVFLLHRDNLAVPAGEFVDCLNRQHQAGRIGVFGASNWTAARLEQANRYASARGLTGMDVVSNQFGLVPMLTPLWEGALTSATPELIDWHERTQTSLLAYTPLARGFLAQGERSRERALEVSAFDSADNRARRDRALQVAAERGCSLVDVALAYVLCQSFPTFAIIGPRSSVQLQSALSCLELELSRRELEWLASGES
jgi:aryl-alcohol dehydrogenase-like predicted oxidoreductase